MSPCGPMAPIPFKTRRAPRKYEPGEPFAGIGEFVRWAQSGLYVHAWGRVQHPSIALNQQVTTIIRLIQRQQLRRAVIRREWRDWDAQQEAAE